MNEVNTNILICLKNVGNFFATKDLKSSTRFRIHKGIFKMLKQILFLLCFWTLTHSIFAQTEKTVAPTKWERYSFEENSVSVLLPKMPVVYPNLDECNSQESVLYGSYSDGVAYVFRTTREYKGQNHCITRKRFDEKKFVDRVKEIKNTIKDFESDSSKKIDDFDVTILKGKQRVYWLYNDFPNKRWFEFWVIGDNDSKKEAFEFLNSLKIGKSLSGINISKGSPITLGDETASKTDLISQSSPSPENNKKLSIVLQSYPKYTEEARKKLISGDVFLKITFDANGSISSIEPIKGLEYGLTEQAITAAKKILFLPEIQNGIRVSISKTVVYNFRLVQ